MTATERKQALPADESEAGKRPRNDPERMKAFAGRLNVMLGELGLPPRGRARVIKERVGVSGTTAANWLRGETYPSFEELGRMGRQLGVDPSRLFDDSAELAKSGAKTTLIAAKQPARLARLIRDNQIAPLTQLKTENGEWDHTALPNSIWTQLLGRGLAGFVLLHMRGDAMVGRIPDGTPLLVDTSDTRIADDNGVYALLLGDRVMVRRVQRRLQGDFLIACDNPSIATETMDRLGSYREDAARETDVLVLGRVALAMQKL